MQLQSPAAQSAWSDEAYRRFWKRMGDVFGLRWYEQNGPEPTPSWKNGLQQHDIKHVMAAIMGFETRPHSGYPPNLPQFIAEIREARNAATPSDVALPAPKRDPEKIERMAAGLKSLRDYTVKATQKIMGKVR
jgi:hypothetical protein